MPPPILLSPSSVDLDVAAMPRDEILKLLPHRYEFQLIDGVARVDFERKLIVGFHDVRSDGFWARGHIPGRPLFPGVLMIEVAAQLSSLLYNSFIKTNVFLGFAGVDGVKFRGTVSPPSRLVVVASAIEVRPRRMISACQGFVGETMVFEAQITGMPI
jgi:3-hydroxyacyl-[acyl-carrier-protein] dehydratase